MTLLWVRPPAAEAAFSLEERRLRDYVASRAGVSETVASLCAKLGLRSRQCRRILDDLVREGVLTRREFDDIFPIYYRYPSR